ncbi:MAG: hypothetical protein IPL55_09910 [Saprospiraceae bacterium]|nr:hypothetical protein [Saprospiraceae bacterium]
MATLRNVQLITKQNLGYQSFVNSIIRANKNLKSTKSIAPSGAGPSYYCLAMHRISKKMENIFRNWINSGKECIISYEVRQGHKWVTLYRELDGITFDQFGDPHIYELKCSNGLTCNARKQLEASASILKCVYNQVYMHLYICDFAFRIKSSDDIRVRYLEEYYDVHSITPFFLLNYNNESSNSIEHLLNFAEESYLKAKEKSEQKMEVRKVKIDIVYEESDFSYLLKDALKKSA